MQEILFAIFFLAIGFVLLIKGADFFVDGSSAVAKLLRVPPIIIGLTVVAMGTSLPELAVSVTAAMSGNNALAVSNVVGSNIFNILLILGLAAVISPVTFIFENMIDIVLLTAMSLLVWIFGWTRQRLCRTEGMVMLAIYAVYLVYICIR